MTFAGRPPAGIAGDLERAVFRANPRYELVLVDRLSTAERALLGASEVADLYGVLRPRGGEGPDVRAVTSETALLFLTLGEPAPLPGYVRARLGDELESTIARLVVDGVLEVEHGGRFVGGSEAAGLVLSARSSGGRGHIGELSVAALRYGQELVDLPTGELALRLYSYGRRPVSPTLASRLADGAAFETYLGLQPGGALEQPLAAGWVEAPATGGGRRYWRSWRAKRAGAMRDGPDPGYKLYVSPALDALPRAIEAVADSLASGHGAKAFKVGADIGGLCRPDKLVVYFDRLDDLQDAAVGLERRLGVCPAHGVPFTAAITADGVLSWGADPPVLGADAGRVTSWRLWVSELLADYLQSGATDRASGLQPWQFALERLRLAGIDTDTWVPVSGMWREAAVSA